MRLPVSIIIPAYNEEKYLPALLDSIKSQTVQPQEVIVVDAYSEDRTAAIVAQYGFTLLRLRKKGPSRQRNYGAKMASSDLLLFLDADVILPPTFLEETISEMMKENLDVASCYVRPLSSKKTDRVLHTLVNYYLTFTKSFFLHAPGCCIFASRAIHQKIGGFDETLFLGEDHDYVQKAEKISKFSYLHTHKIPISIRRLEREGRWTITRKYISMELHLFFLGKIRKSIFVYESH